MLAAGESIVVAMPRVFSNEPGADAETTTIVALTPRIIVMQETDKESAPSQLRDQVAKPAKFAKARTFTGNLFPKRDRCPLYWDVVARFSKLSASALGRLRQRHAVGAAAVFVG